MFDAVLEMWYFSECLKIKLVKCFLVSNFMCASKVVNLNVFTNLLLENLVLVKFRLSISECFDCCSSASHSMYKTALSAVGLGLFVRKSVLS